MHSMSLYLYRSCRRIEASYIYDTFLCTIDCIAYRRLHQIIREDIETVSCLFIRGEIDFYIRMRYGLIGRKDGKHLHDYSHIGFVIASQKRIAAGCDNCPASIAQKIRIVIGFYHNTVKNNILAIVRRMDNGNNTIPGNIISCIHMSHECNSLTIDIPRKAALKNLLRAIVDCASDILKLCAQHLHQILLPRC